VAAVRQRGRVAIVVAALFLMGAGVVCRSGNGVDGGRGGLWTMVKYGAFR
jgi:hypothetical protein